MAHITLESLSKQFGAVKAVNALSLDVKKGEFMTVVGPSGAGKTTTLKLIAGIETPSSGYIRFDGTIINGVEAHQRNVAMAFESYALYPHMSVFDNIASPLRAPSRKLPENIIAPKVRHIAERLGIDMLLDRSPRMLSNGQKQRVALGRALVRDDAEVLLLDEPISHLDAKLRHRMRSELKALEQEIKTTTIYVTHDYLEALSLGDRMAVIQAGHLVQLDTPQAVFQQPANTFVASIIGHPSINLIPAELTRRDGTLQLSGAVTLPLPPKLAQVAEAHPSSEVILGVRPMHLHTQPHTPDRVLLCSGRVYVYERLGTRGVLTVTLDHEEADEQLNVLTPLEMSFDIDDQVTLYAQADELMLFDAYTQRNLLSP